TAVASRWPGAPSPCSSRFKTWSISAGVMWAWPPCAVFCVSNSALRSSCNCVKNALPDLSVFRSPSAPLARTRSVAVATLPFVTRAAGQRAHGVRGEPRSTRKQACLISREGRRLNGRRERALVRPRRQRLAEQERDRLPHGRGMDLAAGHIKVGAGVIHNAL